MFGNFSVDYFNLKDIKKFYIETEDGKKEFDFNNNFSNVLKTFIKSSSEFSYSSHKNETKKVLKVNFLIDDYIKNIDFNLYYLNNSNLIIPNLIFDKEKEYEFDFEKYNFAIFDDKNNLSKIYLDNPKKEGYIFKEFLIADRRTNSLKKLNYDSEKNQYYITYKDIEDQKLRKFSLFNYQIKNSYKIATYMNEDYLFLMYVKPIFIKENQ